MLLTTEILVEAYKQGLFPMAYHAHSPYIQWVCPERRGQLSISDLHIPKRLLGTIRRAPYEIQINQDFESVIRSCGEMREDRPETWINEDIIRAYNALHKEGYAHSVECWRGGALVGGVYGIALGAAFFGESMFSRSRDASKIALVHLTARLWKGGFTLFDTQFVNPHIAQFGAYEIPHDLYKKKLQAALLRKADFLLPACKQKTILATYLDFRKGAKPPL